MATYSIAVAIQQTTGVCDMAHVDIRTGSPARVPAPLIGLAVVAMGGVLAVLLFVPAGRLNWIAGWIYVGVLVTWVAINWACLLRWNPELIERRMHIGKGTKTWDIVWLVLFAPVLCAVYVVAGFEARDGVSSLPGIASLFGLGLFVPGAALLTWPMAVNPFFEKTVRIQTDHGHRVIDTGPYAYLRHPGYLGLIGLILGTPLLLASAWAFVPALAAVAGVVIRTALEDRTLRRELRGYAEYTTRIRFRLIPGVW